MWKDYQIPAEKLFLEEMFLEIVKHKINVPILLLLILKILPLYTSKKGEVENIQDDFQKMYRFIKKFIGQDEALSNHPMLSRFEKEVKEAYCNRLYLIYIMFVILETYRSFKNPMDLYELYNDLRKSWVIFDLGNSFWVEPENLSTPSVFWEF